MARKRLQKKKFFRLFDLPFIPLKTAFSCFDVFGLFDLALCSKNAKKLIKCTARRVLKIDIRVNKSCHQFWLKTGDGQCCGRWDFERDSIRGRKKEFRTIGEHRFRYKKDIISIARTNHSQPEVTMKSVLSVLKHIFDCQIIEIDVWTSGLGPFFNYLSGMESCENFKCDGGNTISNDDLNFVMNELKVTGNFEMKVAINKVSDCSYAVFTSKSVVLNSWPHWMSSNNLLGSDCEKIFLKCCEFPLETYELFLTSWLKGSSLRRLKHIRIVDWKEHFELEVLNSFGAVWNPQQRGRHFILNEEEAVDCSEGIDVIRCDGMLATVLPKYGRFQMFVWHERFPVLTEHIKAC